MSSIHMLVGGDKNCYCLAVDWYIGLERWLGQSKDAHINALYILVSLYCSASRTDEACKLQIRGKILGDEASSKQQVFKF